jgi:hypothetical protein
MGDQSFYEPGPLRHLAINLFNGWGYNFYREENQLRADDQLVRSKAAWLLGLAAASIAAAEAEHRRETMPAPTRAHPYPDPAAVAGAQALERLGRAVSALVGRVGAQPVPENDRMTQRYRFEAATLAALAGHDEVLVGQCELLRSRVEGRGGAWMLENLAGLEAGVAAIEATLRDRAGLLQDRAA